MNIKARIDEIKSRAPKPKWRAAHGQWIEPAWVVRGLVEAGQPVTEACRIVTREMKLRPADAAVKGLRQAYYEVRTRPWPKNSGKRNPKSKKQEDFEV